MSLAAKMWPIFAQGTVIKGFGRGSKELGIPTANFSEEVVSGLPADLSTGIYFGWAKVDNSDQVHKMVMSIGWNPYFKNEKKSMETHIMHDFGTDFYGSWLRVLICGYIRPEENFKSLEALVTAIHADIAKADKELECEDLKKYKTHEFFSRPFNSQSSPASTNSV